MSDTELLLKPEAVRRVEVFTGTGRRRKWTVDQKARMVAESYAVGESVCGVARRHGLTPQQLFSRVYQHHRPEAVLHPSTSGSGERRGNRLMLPQSV